MELYHRYNLQFQDQHIQKKRSIKSMLNRNGPKIEPSGTPYSMLLFLLLQLILILTR